MVNYPVWWSALNEEQRYAVWSDHVAVGGRFMYFFEFCDVMDACTK